MRAGRKLTTRVFQAFSTLILVTLFGGGCSDTGRFAKETVASTDEDDVPAVSSTPVSDVDEGRNWSHYGRDVEEMHFSPLQQINDRNITELGLSWFRGLPVMISSNSAPLAIDGVLFSEAFYGVVHDGGLESRGMPRFDELSRQEVEDLRQLVRSVANQSVP